MFTPDPRITTDFFVAGGTLPRDVRSYVPRRADEELHKALMGGKFCYVLTSRQMGKSSLMVRGAERLRAERLHVAVLDLTALGSNLTATQWYLGLLTQVGEGLGLDVELEDYWEANAALSPLQRWTGAFRDIVLPKTTGKVVIFVDEIDLTRSLPFSTDEFFAAIREFYNRRAQDPSFERLTFCLLGVATPSDLIRDVRTTPFNIGERIELTDFTADEAQILLPGLERPDSSGQVVLKRILYWTGGHPWLTQRFCQAVASDPSVHNAAGVDRVCEGLFLSASAREKSDNLTFVRDRILRSDADHAALLDIYERIRSHQRVKDDPAHPLLSILRLSGITRLQEGYLYVRNRIYYRVFDKEWVQSNLPVDEVARQKAAVRRALIKTVSIAALIVIVVTGLGIFAWIKSAQLEIKVGELNKQKVMTQNEADEANKQKGIAELNAKNAKEQEDKATASAKEANRQRSIALENSLEAKKQSAIADANAQKAESQQKIAEDNATKAKAAQADAETRKKLAEDETAAFLKYGKDTAIGINRQTSGIADPKVMAAFGPVWENNLKFLDDFKKMSSGAGQQIAVLQALNYMLLCDSNRFGSKWAEAAKACTEGIKIGETLAKAPGITVDAKEDLFLLYERAGLVLSAQGKHDEARGTFLKCLSTAQDLVKDDKPIHLEDLWFANQHLGDLYSEMNKQPEALESYNEELKTAQDLVLKDKDYQRDLWVAYKRIGDLRQTEGNAGGYQAALKAYQDSMPTAQELAKLSPQGKQDLWLTQVSIGEMLTELKQYDKAETAFRDSLKTTVEQIPTNLLNQVVSDERLGDALLAQDKKPEALEIYKKSFELATERTKNGGRDVQRSLAISYYKMSLIHDAMGNPEAARTDLQQRINIFARVLAQNTDTSLYVVEGHDLAAGYLDLGDFENAHNQVDAAHKAYKSRVDTYEQIVVKNMDAQAVRDWYAAYTQLATLEETHHNVDLARDDLKKRIAFLEDFANKGGNKQPPSQLETSYRDLADFEEKQGKVDAARQAYRAGIAFLEARTKDPKNAAAKSQLASLYGSLAWFEVLHSQFQSAIEAANSGISLDPSQLWIKVNLAHGYLFANKVDQARDIYLTNKDAKIGDHRFRDDVLADFKELKSKGFKSTAMDAIEAELKQDAPKAE